MGVKWFHAPPLYVWGVVPALYSLALTSLARSRELDLPVLYGPPKMTLYPFILAYGAPPLALFWILLMAIAGVYGSRRPKLMALLYILIVTMILILPLVTQDLHGPTFN